VKATLIIDCHDVIGEAPFWDLEHDRLLWTDNKQGLLHEARSNAAGQWLETRHWSVGRRIGAAIPRAGGGFIVATGTEFVTLDEAGQVAPFARLDVEPTMFHLNDAKCDARGRLWAGTLDSHVNIPGRDIIPGRGALYRIDPDRTVTAVVPGITVSNGMDWSPDGATFYYIDTYTRRVDAFDFDETRGTLANRRATIQFKAGEGAPDGMTVDAGGCLWVALAGIGEVRQYSEHGDYLMTVHLDTPTPTSCAFGGADSRDLFITSARVRVPDASFSKLTQGFSVEVALMSTPGAGGLYVCRPGVAGRRAHVFAG
jgi:sugar lactone lactonase YvrE